MQAETAFMAGPQEIRSFMHARGFAPCDTKTDTEALRQLACRLIPGAIASTAVLADAHRRTGHSLFLCRENGRPTAFIACLSLTRAGANAIRSGRFDGLAIAPEWIAPFGPLVHAGYIWGLGGVTRRATFSAMRALRIMRQRFFSHIDLFARASTPEGRRIMAGFGYRAAAGPDPDVMLAPAIGPAALARAS
ncbi:hypothetical protein [Terricaulis silvestris]|uniref:N-acetyltransferase domain-containing protein n=1 Tax=Terricaulis silvestris TaxID=2686094 RepID=A0A6I6MTC0_9CAUL|nr:hypothetical protein [Terricaulis silvestris]QGZ96608.1 hypothetical protein DSM104635_03468 [Terricaulis silvestris]